MGMVGGALAASCFLAGCDSAPPPSIPTAEWQQPFDTIQHYWSVTRGLGKLGVRLRIIEPGEREVCGNYTDTAYSKSIGNYCPDDNTVYISSGSYKAFETEYVAKGGNARALKILFMGHEEGHAVQEKYRSVEEPPSKVPALNKRHEQQADCLDGELISGLGGISLGEAQLMYDVFDIITPLTAAELRKDDHGREPERFRAFVRGGDKEYGVIAGCGLVLPTEYPNGKVTAGV